MTAITNIRSYLATDASIEARTKQTLIKCFDELDFSVNLPITTTDGGTGADLSATGGAHQVVQQAAPGDPFTVGQLAASDLSNGAFGATALSTTSTVTATGKVLTTAGLGVGNSATATVAVGTLAKKIEVLRNDNVSYCYCPYTAE